MREDKSPRSDRLVSLRPAICTLLLSTVSGGGYDHAALARQKCGLKLKGRPKLCPRALGTLSPFAGADQLALELRQPAENGQHLRSVTSVGNDAPHCPDDSRERPRAVSVPAK
jgi:hypothetical protein